MAIFNLSVPSKNFPPLGDADPTVFRGQLKSATSSNVANLKNSYGSMIKEVATNSNIPSELLGSMIIALSDGKNNSGYTTPDRLVRSGIFSLSQKVAKEILSREVAQGRLSEAERAFLIANDPAIASYLGPKGNKAQNEHWSSDANNPSKINDKSNPFNLLNPKVSAQLGAIWIGQLWDAFAKQTSNPIDKVIITMSLPYGTFTGTGLGSDYSQSFLSGNRLIVPKPWNIDYTDPKNIGTLPKPSNAKQKLGVSNIINPYGGAVQDALKLVLAKNGTLDLLSK